LLKIYLYNRKDFDQIFFINQIYTIAIGIKKGVKVTEHKKEGHEFYIKEEHKSRRKINI